MRAILIITAFALILMISVAQSQENELPACSTEEFAAFHDSIDGIRDLIQKVANIRTMDDLLAHSNAHLEWREHMWSSLPLCAEAFEIALLANQLIGDYVPLILLNSRRDARDENPYRAGQQNGLTRLEALMTGLPSPSTVADPFPASTLPACTASEKQLIHDTLLPEYGDLTDIANGIEDTAGYLQYVEAQLAWRQSSLTRYPSCVESIEIAWLTSQTAGDISALFAFDFIGLPEDDNPYSEPERRGTRRVGEFHMLLRAPLEPSEDLHDTTIPDEVIETLLLQATTPSGGNWQRCSADKLRSFAPLLTEYQYLENMAVEVLTLEQLLEYSIAQIQWRESLTSQLPQCGEVLGIAWIISENIGDLALLYALNFLEVAVEDGPIFAQVMGNNAGIQVWSDSLPGLIANYDNMPGSSSETGSLPACADTELNTLDGILSQHLAIFNSYDYIKDVNDLLSFVEALVNWREESWSRMPLCNGIIEMFLRINWFSNDNLVALALKLSDLPDDDNPYLPQLTIGKDQINLAHAAVLGSDQGTDGQQEHTETAEQ